MLVCSSFWGCYRAPEYARADAESYVYPDAEPLDDLPDTGIPPRPDRGEAGVPDTGEPNVDAGDDRDAGFPDAPAPDADAGPPPDTGPRNPVTGLPAPVQIGTNFGLAEGPTWRAPNLPPPSNANGMFVFSDIINRVIQQASPPNWQVQQLRPMSNAANGLANDVNGLLLAAEHDTRRISRTLANGTVETLADRWEGLMFNSPNDLVVRDDGTIFFTDPPYGLAGRQRFIPFNGIFRITPGGVVSDEWQGSATAPESLPNGIELSPDEAVLYVADSARGVVMAFDVATDGTLSNERIFVTPMGQAPDGIAVDEDGNVYVATSVGFEVFDTAGVRWGVITLPGVVPNNMTFGGADRRIGLITAGTLQSPMSRVFRIDRMNVPGRP